MKHCLLDSSFVIDLLNEIAGGKEGAALGWLRRNGAAVLWISPVTLAEVLEGAEDPDAVKDYLRRYSWQGIHRAHADLVATRQRRASRRMGENDAWQAAITEQMGAVLIGHDKAFKRLGAGYEDHWRN
jgi:predicted nucleic acid-binding protein